MELRHLRYFVEVARQGSISRASEKLFVAQPALSSQIRQLEQMLDAPLFVRHARGVQLTEGGERFLIDAHAILEQVERASAQAKQVATRGAQTLRIGFIPSSAYTLLPALVDTLRRRGPGLSLHTREMITAEQFEALNARAIDVAISRPLELPDSCRALAEMADPYCLAIPAGHRLARQAGPLALAQAADEDFVAFTRFTSPAYFDRTMALCVDARFSPRLRHEASGFGNALQLVALGLGVCIVPASLVLICPPGAVFRLLRKVRRSDRLVLLAPARGVHPEVLGIVEPARREMAKLQRAIARRILSAVAQPCSPFHDMYAASR